MHTTTTNAGMDSLDWERKARQRNGEFEETIGIDVPFIYVYVHANKQNYATHQYWCMRA